MTIFTKSSLIFGEKGSVYIRLGAFYAGGMRCRWQEGELGRMENATCSRFV